MAQAACDLEAGLERKEMSVDSSLSPRTATTFCEGSVLSYSGPRGSKGTSLDPDTQQRSWASRFTSFLRRSNSEGTLPTSSERAPAEHAQLTVRKLEACQPGFPRLGAFLDSDENFMVYRRFGYVFSRLLLHKQSRLQRLEQALDDIDQADSDEDPDSLMHTDWIDDGDNHRTQLFQDLERTAREYAELLSHAKELAATSRPSNFEYKSVCNYVAQPLLFEDDEPKFKLKEDLITLRPGREHAWLDESIEYCLRIFHCKPLHNLFCSEATRQKADGTDTVIYYTRSRINLLASAIITIAILALLIAPIYILYRLTAKNDPGPHTPATCIGTLLVFTLAFSAVLAFFTRARRHEILGAAAAYCAVLVVFLSNVPISQPFSKS